MAAQSEPTNLTPQPMANSPPLLPGIMNNQFHNPTTSPQDPGHSSSVLPYASHTNTTSNPHQLHQHQHQANHATYNAETIHTQQHYTAQHGHSHVHSMPAQPMHSHLHHQQNNQSHVQHQNHQSQMQNQQHLHHNHHHAQSHLQTLQHPQQTQLSPHPIALQSHPHPHAPLEVGVGVETYAPSLGHLHHNPHHLHHQVQPTHQHLHAQLSHQHQHTHSHPSLLPQAQNQASHLLHHQNQQMHSHNQAHMQQSQLHHSQVPQNASLYHQESNVTTAAYTTHNPHVDHQHPHHAHSMQQLPAHHHDHHHHHHHQHHQQHQHQHLRSPPMVSNHGVSFGPSEYMATTSEVSPASHASSPSHQILMGQSQPQIGIAGALADSPSMSSNIVSHYPNDIKPRVQTVCGEMMGTAVASSRSTSNSSASSSVTIAAAANLSASSSPKSSQNPLIATSNSTQQVCRRQSSSVMSTSSAGSNISDYPGLKAESPTTNVQASISQVTTVARTPINVMVGATTPDQSSRSIGSLDTAINETEHDNRESQLSQLHQQCAILLNEQQSHAGVLNSPSSSNPINRTNSSNSNNNATTSNVNSSNSGRSKRLRTSFKHNQLKEMKKYFARNQNPDAKELKNLAQHTQLSKRVLQVIITSDYNLKAFLLVAILTASCAKIPDLIQVWFQNARAKYRRNNAKVASQQLYDVNQQTSHLLQYQQQPTYQHNPY